MLALLKQTRTGFFIAMVGVMLLSAISPVLTLANGDLVPGDDAIVSNATNLYSDYSFDASILAEVAADTPVSIEDGTFTGADGSLWYAVEVWNLEGFVPASDLTGLATDETETEESNTTDNASPDVEVSVLPWQEPIAFGVADNNVTCRDAATTGGNEITMVSAGQTVEVTGAETWVDGMSWTPVNCGGQGGFIATDFLNLDNGEEEATEVATETATATETEVATEEATAEETELTEAVPSRSWMPPIDTLSAIDNVVCRAAPSTSAQELTTVGAGAIVEVTGEESWAEGLSWTPVNCAGTGGFIATDFLGATDAEEATATEVATEVVTETVTEPEVVTETAIETVVVTDAATEEVTVDETTTEEATETAVTAETATDVPTEDIPSADDIIEDVNADIPAADDIIEDVTEDVPEADDIVENVTEEATEEVTVDETTTEEATEADDIVENVTEEATEEVTVDEAATDVPTEDVPAADDIVEDITEDVPEAGVIIEDVLENVEPEVTVTEEATVEATEAATEETTPEETEAETATEESLTDNLDEELGGIAVPETESTSPVSDDEILGTAEVTGTNGQGIACRTAPDANASVIRVLPEGMNVLVLSQPDDGGWMSILCDNQIGYAHSMYLYSGGAMSHQDFGNSLYAYVSGTGGGGLNCRSSASINSSVIGWLPEGSAVNVRGAAQGDWLPVVCGGQNGWVHADYVSAGLQSSDSNNSGNSGGGGSTSGTATVVNTNGDGLRCRTSPNGSVITVMGEGTRVSVRGAAEGGWLPIVCAGQNGYAHSDYLSVNGSSGNGSGSNNDGGSGNNGGGVTGGNVTVTGTGGSSLNCRSGAGTSNSVITAVREGTVLKTRGAASNGWQPVVCGGQNGWVSTQYITAGGQLGADNPAPTPSPEPEPQPAGLSNGDHAKTTSNLNLRYEPSSGAGIATYAPAGTVVLITGGHAGNGYFPVNWDGLKGFMHGDYLTKTDEALSKRGGSGNPTSPPTSGGGGSTATGNAIVDYAMGYLGYPYVWATHGPSSFDCSGFTYWVIANVVGKDIGYGLWTQVSAGQAVSRNSLQPGDLVFFQNTYKAGLSHVGIYIGDNQFIHAQNEATGVVISDLNSNYYGSRWYGAVRIN